MVKRILPFAVLASLIALLITGSVRRSVADAEREAALWDEARRP